MSRPDVLLPPASDYALRIKHTYKTGWKQRYLLIGDCHWDSPECYLRLLHRHLQEAKETDALIIDNGDFFDVIGGINDKRATKGSVVEEHSKLNYLDEVVEQGVDEFRPYADQFIYCGTGNHETSVLVRKETDITRRWVDDMNRVRTAGLPPIHRAGYTGWIRFMFNAMSGSNRFSMAMKLEHGTGGNSPVTKGTIQANRRQVRTHGATWFVTSHIHESWAMNYVVETLNLSSSRVELRRTQHVQLGSYKMDFRPDGVSTWAMMKMGDPKPIGGVWLEFYSRTGDIIEWRTYPVDVDYANIQDYLRPKARVVRS
jgi:hypothetical protein